MRQGLLRVRALIGALSASACLSAVPAHGMVIYLSTTNGATIGGLTIRDGDIARYDTVSGVATLFFDEDLFAASENVDAFVIRPNGNILLSTTSAATLGGLTFRDGDIAEYNPGTNTATLFFNENLFSNDADIDAFDVLGNGHYVLSTAAGETVAGLAFRDGDLVEYDPVSATASIFLNENLFAANENIDAVHVLADGSMILSTVSNASIGGLAFLDGDLVRYVPATNTATLVFSESAFGGGENIDAVFGPEPATGLLLALGLAGLSIRRRTA